MHCATRPTTSRAWPSVALREASEWCAAIGPAALPSRPAAFPRLTTSPSRSTAIGRQPGSTRPATPAALTSNAAISPDRRPIARSPSGPRTKRPGFIFILNMPTLPDRYDFATAEPEIDRAGLEAGCFDARVADSSRTGGAREPYTIVMPPPNVTAILHVGHGLNNTIQDVIIRWARMRGSNALWVPGTDHAGIATQNVVEKMIATEGKTRFDLGRGAFVRRTEAFVAETGGTILQQLRAIGASADWRRTAYTLSTER